MSASGPALPESTALKDFDLGPVVRVDGDSYSRVAEHDSAGMNVFFRLRITPKRRMVEKDMVQSVWRERKILLEQLAPLNHVFVTKFLAAFQDENNLYLVSEFVNGGTLYRHLRVEERFNRHRARVYAAQMVLAVDFLHTNNILHRNLKPENIWLSADGFIKLAGFELAKDLPHAAKTCTFCGTPEYMAPEVRVACNCGRVEFLNHGLPFRKFVDTHVAIARLHRSFCTRDTAGALTGGLWGF